jgi:hypothetical protein
VILFFHGGGFSIKSIFLFDLIPKLMFNRVMAGNKNSGKKKGATSFLAVELRLIQEKVTPNAEIIVSRKWAEAVGLSKDGRKLAMKQNTAESMSRPINIEEKEMDAINF